MTWAIKPVREDKGMSLARSLIVSRRITRLGCGGRAFGGKSLRRNFSYIDSLSNDLALLRPCGCGSDYSTTFRDMAPSGIHPLMFKRELGLLLGLRLRCGISLRPLGLWFGSMSSLRIGGSALLPLTATTIVSSMVRIAVGTSFLFVCHRALSIRNEWASTGHTSRRVTTITLRVTKAQAVFALCGFLRIPISIDYHSENTQRRKSTHLANTSPASYRNYEVRCGEPVLSRIGIAALRVEL